MSDEVSIYGSSYEKVAWKKKVISKCLVDKGQYEQMGEIRKVEISYMLRN